jgi:hypothetical protein
VPFESFRAEIEAVVLTPAEHKKSNAGRKPTDVIVMFRMLVLQSLYNLSDEQVEYHVRDCMSFTRFLRLGNEDRIPDGTVHCRAGHGRDTPARAIPAGLHRRIPDRSLCMVPSSR